MIKLPPTSSLTKPSIAPRVAALGIIEASGGVCPYAEWDSCLKHPQTAWASRGFRLVCESIYFSHPLAISTGERYPFEAAWAHWTRPEAALGSHPLRFLAYLARTSWMELLSCSSSCTFSNSLCWLCCLLVGRDQTFSFFHHQTCP